MDTELDKNLVLVISDCPEDLIKDISLPSGPKLPEVIAVCGRVDLPGNILDQARQIPAEHGLLVVSCDNHPKASELISGLASLPDSGLDTASLVQFIAEHTQQIISAQEPNIPDIAEFSLKLLEDSCRKVVNFSEILLKRSDDRPYFVPRHERIKMLNGKFSKKSRFNRKILRR